MMKRTPQGVRSSLGQGPVYLKEIKHVYRSQIQRVTKSRPRLPRKRDRTPAELRSGELRRSLTHGVDALLGQSERRAYLAQASADKGNGGYGRSLNVGPIPVNIEVPRTRSGNFRPRSLPPPYQRGYSDEVQALILGLLGSARSI